MIKVVLVSIDTLRADHLGAYGRSPALRISYTLRSSFPAFILYLPCVR